MEFSFSEKHRRFREEVRAFARAEVTPELLAETHARGSEFHPGFHKKLAERGVPRTVGDTEIGADLRAEIAILEELLHAYDTNTIRAIGPPG